MNSMAYLPGSRRVKSNTPCWPGFTPVIKLVQAGKVAGGVVERSGVQVPASITRARWGSSPEAAQGPMRSNVAPSRPTRSTRVGTSIAQVAETLLNRSVQRAHLAGNGLFPRESMQCVKRAAKGLDLVRRRGGEILLFARIGG